MRLLESKMNQNFATIDFKFDSSVRVTLDIYFLFQVDKKAVTKNYKSFIFNPKINHNFEKGYYVFDKKYLNFIKRQKRSKSLKRV